jgi:hypothetical protein
MNLLNSLPTQWMGNCTPSEIVQTLRSLILWNHSMISVYLATLLLTYYRCIFWQWALFYFTFFCLFIWWDWGLNSGFHACKAGSPVLKPHLQSILLWLFWRWALENYFPGLASNWDPLISASQVLRIIGWVTGPQLRCGFYWLNSEACFTIYNIGFKINNGFYFLNLAMNFNETGSNKN